MKAIKQAKTRNILDSYNKEDILFKNEWNVQRVSGSICIRFCGLCLVIFGRLRDNEITIEESLEIYKKQNE
jgi:adenylate kinase family enzyme